MSAKWVAVMAWIALAFVLFSKAYGDAFSRPHIDIVLAMLMAAFGWTNAAIQEDLRS